MMSLRILQVLILFGTTKFELRHCKSLEIESLQISIPQKFLGSDQTRCLIMIFMSLGHSFSFCSPRRITNSLHYESFENWIYSIVPGNSLNHLLYDDFDVCGIFSNP